MKLDSTDRKLLNLLQEDSKRPIKELAELLNLTVAPVHERIKKLEKSGLIKKYVALVNLDQMERNLITYCSVTIEKHSFKSLDGFETAIRDFDEVMECYMIAGGHDFLLKIIVTGMEEYQHFLLDKLSRVKGVTNVNTQFVMKSVKYSTAIKLPA
ncbi:MAG: Lrp/AsnC family transcriptional regulator [Crocinitomicaceae bacterium]|jgi:DNA-binding Lrp family transcriptional regulator|nr:Lrp/AsnC family transcriptional regulator [Crocinitomicaceae bacterium]